MFISSIVEDKKEVKGYTRLVEGIPILLVEAIDYTVLSCYIFKYSF